MRLFLCEKPSQGKDIGRILGATQRGQGCLNGSGVTITWCIGHLVEAAAPEVYDAALKRWSLEQLPIIFDCGVLDNAYERACMFVADLKHRMYQFRWGRNFNQKTT